MELIIVLSFALSDDAFHLASLWVDHEHPALARAYDDLSLRTLTSIFTSILWI
jgi:hypothetical protein